MKKISLHSWQYYIDNISFVSFNQLEYLQNRFKLGIQYLFQTSLGENSFIEKNYNAQLLSGQIKWNGDQLQLSYNHTIGLTARALRFPSEWGAEPFILLLAVTVLKD